MPKNNVTIIMTPKMLLPNASVDMTKWAVIACDQYTSNKAYWDKVEALVGDAPSTLHITFPEFYLGKIDEAKKIADIQAEERKYLSEKLFDVHPGMILVERHIDNGIRNDEDRIARQKRLGVAVKMVRQTKPIQTGTEGKPAERMYAGIVDGNAYIAVADEHNEIGALEMVSYRRGKRKEVRNA